MSCITQPYESDMYCHSYLSCPCKCIRVWFRYTDKMCWVKYQDFRPVLYGFIIRIKYSCSRCLTVFQTYLLRIPGVQKYKEGNKRGVKVQGYYVLRASRNEFIYIMMWLFIFVLLIKGFFPEPLYKRYILFSLQRFNLGKSSSRNMAHTCTLYRTIWLCSNDATKFIICPIFFKFFFLNLKKKAISICDYMNKHIFETLGVHCYSTVTTTNSSVISVV